MALIDLIIPIYNQEKYIQRTLSALKELNSDIFNIILIDDGSIDNTALLIKKFIKNNKLFNFIYAHKENGGVSSARNFGVGISTSKYIWFFDSDDLPNKDVNQIADDIKANSEVDILCYSYDVFKVKNNEMIERCLFDKENEILEKRKFIEKYSFFSNKNDMSFIWNKIYKRDLVKANPFDETLDLGEDRHFNLRVFSSNGFAFLSRKKIYKYFVYGENTLSSSITYKKNITDKEIVNNLNISLLSGEKSVNDAKSQHIYDKMIFLSILGNNDIGKKYLSECKKYQISIFYRLSFKKIMMLIFIFLGFGGNYFRIKDKVTSHLRK